MPGYSAPVTWNCGATHITPRCTIRIVRPQGFATQTFSFECEVKTIVGLAFQRALSISCCWWRHFLKVGSRRPIVELMRSLLPSLDA